MGHASEIVHKIIRLVDINEYKRKQAAPALKTTPLAFGVEEECRSCKNIKTKFIYESIPSPF